MLAIVGKRPTRHQAERGAEALVAAEAGATKIWLKRDTRKQDTANRYAADIVVTAVVVVDAVVAVASASSLLDLT